MNLIVDRPGVLASRTLVKHGLPFVNTSQLDRIVSNFGASTFDTRFLDRCSRGLFVSCQSLLFDVCFGPQWCSPVGRIRHRRRNFGRIEFVEVRRVRTYIAGNRTGAVDFQRGSTRGAKWPRHAVQGVVLLLVKIGTSALGESVQEEVKSGTYSYPYRAQKH